MKATGHGFIVLILLVSCFSVTMPLTTSSAEEYIAHNPIKIDGNEDFAFQAVNNSWPGDGTEGNPYIIQGYEINSSTGSGIDIRATSLYFIIKNTRIYDGLFGHESHLGNYGIFLYNVQNGMILDSVFERNKIGIYVTNGTQLNIEKNILYSNYYESIALRESTNNCITGNNITDSRNGIYVSSSDNNSISQNHIFHCQIGIYMHSSNENDILGNDVKNLKNGYGISIYYSEKNNVNNNNLISNYNGMFIYSCNNLNIIRNNATSNNSTGIRIEASYEIYLMDNIAFENWIGLELSESNECDIIQNTAEQNKYGMYLPSSYRNYIMSNRAHNNEFAGILLYRSETNDIKINTFSENDKGIQFQFSYKNNVTKNTITNNDHGLYLGNSSYNIYHHNKIKTNQHQVNVTNCTDEIWHDGFCEGNYWSDYNGIDKDGDGVGDTNLPHQGLDHYPLIEKKDKEGFNTSLLVIIPIFIISIILLWHTMKRKHQKDSS